MLAFLRRLLGLPRGHVARAIEEALRHQEVPLSRGQRRKLTNQVLAALEQLGR